MTEIPAHRLRPPRRIGRTIRVWWFAVRPVVAAGLVGGLVTYALMGGLSSTSSTLPGNNAAVGLIDAVRVGDPSACSMTTPAGARDLVRLLRQAGATVPGTTGRPGAWVGCADALANAPSQVRADAMRPFLGIVGLGKDSNGSGSSGSGSRQIEWTESPGGRFAVVVVRHRSAEGLLVDAIRLQAACAACQ